MHTFKDICVKFATKIVNKIEYVRDKIIKVKYSKLISKEYTMQLGIILML